MNLYDVIIMTLVVSLVLLTGCASHNNPIENITLNESQESITEQTPINETQESITEQTPINETQESITEQTPINETQITPIINITSDIEQTEGNEEIQSFEYGEHTDKPICHYVEKIFDKSSSNFNISNGNIILEIIELDYQENIVTMVVNEDETIEFPVNVPVEIEFKSNQKTTLEVTLIRENYAVICINTNEEYDIAYCESLPDDQRFSCFDNLGYLYGLTYCEDISNPDDRATCEAGAQGMNG